MNLKNNSNLEITTSAYVVFIEVDRDGNVVVSIDGAGPDLEVNVNDDRSVYV